MREADFCLLSLRFNVFNAQAAWLCCLNSAAFVSLKKYATHFFNFAFGATEPKETPYETTGIDVKERVLIDLKFFPSLYLNQLETFLSLTHMR